jgi:hypothetical protein
MCGQGFREDLWLKGFGFAFGRYLAERRTDGTLVDIVGPELRSWTGELRSECAVDHRRHHR